MKILVFLLVFCLMPLLALAQDPPPLDFSKVNKGNYLGNYKLSDIAIDSVFWQKVPGGDKNISKKKNKNNKYFCYLQVQPALTEIRPNDSVLNGGRRYYFFIAIRVNFSEDISKTVSVRANYVEHGLFRLDLSEVYNKLNFAAASYKKENDRYVYNDDDADDFFRYLKYDSTIKICLKILGPTDSSARL
jgi:hypothetical protein